MSLLRLFSLVMTCFICVFACIYGNVAHARSVDSVKIIPQGESTRVDLFLSTGTPAPTIFEIPGANPRVVVDFKVAQAKFGGKASGAGQKVLPGSGHITQIRHASRGKEGLRIVFDLIPGTRLATKADSHFTVAGKVTTAPPQAPSPSLLHIQPSRQIVSNSVPSSSPAPVVTVNRYFPKAIPFPRLKPHGQTSKSVAVTSTKPRRNPVIVIDAGHGGYDPGAIGTKGTHEKEITFAAAAELRRQLLAMGRYTVILTRSKDVYIDHEERLRIARAGGADLFISIHADSTASKKARGASVYTLADRAKTRSRNIVNTQNWIMDVDLTEQSDPVGDILVDLAQRKTKSQSDAFAEILLAQLQGTTKLVGNSHRRAGYFVLLAPDVPAVLLELGFLSNPDDEKLLKQSNHRKKLMTSVRIAINRYFDRQTK